MHWRSTFAHDCESRTLEKKLQKKAPFVTFRTGEKPAIVVELSALPGNVHITVKSVAFVPGAALVTLGQTTLHV